MAIFTKQGSTNINEVRAVAQGPERGSALKTLLPFTPSEADFNTYASGVNTRYDQGGSTTWERPPASGQ
jgi:hypothetical protein